LGLRVIGIDHPSKKDLVMECGAEVFIDHTQGKAEEEVCRECSQSIARYMLTFNLSL
jgi:hypothetical protein